jgi:hypothetical protein
VEWRIWNSKLELRLTITWPQVKERGGFIVNLVGNDSLKEIHLKPRHRVRVRKEKSLLVMSNWLLSNPAKEKAELSREEMMSIPRKHNVDVQRTQNTMTTDVQRGSPCPPSISGPTLKTECIHALDYLSWLKN